MARITRPELSKRNPYYISKHRYYELKHFCLQYPEWVSEMKNIRLIRNDIFDPTGDSAVKLAILNDKKDLVETTAHQCAGDLYSWLMKGVTEEYAYPYLSTMLGIPCCRDTYYDIYRKFFWLLSQKKQGV